MEGQLDSLHDIPKREKGLFEAHFNTLGSALGSEIDFKEALRW
jgi:hypothetical protein